MKIVLIFLIIIQFNLAFCEDFTKLTWEEHKVGNT
jgi:hypothetical protein